MEANVMKIVNPTYFFKNDFAEFEDWFLSKNFVHKVFEKGTIISHSYEARDHCYFVLNGIALFSIVHESGREKVISFRGEKTIFPFYCLNNSETVQRSLEIRAYTDVVALVVPKPELYKMMMENAKLTLCMSEAYCKLCGTLVYELESILFEPYTSRICNFIHVCCNAGEFHFTHQEISMITGVSRSNVSRVLSELKKQGIVETKKNSIHILDPKRLASLCKTELQ